MFLTLVYIFTGFLTGSLLLSISTEGRTLWGGHEPNFIEKTVFFFIIISLSPVTLTVTTFYLISDFIAKREGGAEDTVQPVILPL